MLTVVALVGQLVISGWNDSLLEALIVIGYLAVGVLAMLALLEVPRRILHLTESTYYGVVALVFLGIAGRGEEPGTGRLGHPPLRGWRDGGGGATSGGMPHPETWLKPLPQGLFCEPGGFFIDPVRPVDRAVITHAHSDHARPGHRAVLATPADARADAGAAGRRARRRRGRRWPGARPLRSARWS